MKYLVRPVKENYVCDSIFETVSLIEAVRKVQEQFEEKESRCIIVSCPGEMLGPSNFQKNNSL
jgi:hypothetical protein